MMRTPTARAQFRPVHVCETILIATEIWVKIFMIISTATKVNPLYNIQPTQHYVLRCRENM